MLNDDLLSKQKMSGCFSKEQLDHYVSHGFHPKVDVVSSEEAGKLLGKVEEFERSFGMLFSHRDNLFRYKMHLMFSWVDKLMREPALLDVVEVALGTENILVRATDIFVKEANDPSFISFHQDSTYWGLDTTKVLTAWVALTDSNLQNGVMQVVPKTHTKRQMRHVSKPNKNNMLTNCQEVESGFSAKNAVALELKPGQASLHDFQLVHGSEPNKSDQRRVGIAIRYMATDVKLAHDKPDYATLVRGKDEYGHFCKEIAPCSDIDPASIPLLNQFQKVMTATAAINFDVDLADV